MLNAQLSKKALYNVNGTCNLTFWATGTIEPWLSSGAEKPDIQTMVHKTVQKYKVRFKEAWEDLSDR